MLVQIQNTRDEIACPPPAPPSLFHLFETELGNHALLVNGSRVFTLSQEIAERLDRSADPEPLLASLGLSAPEYITSAPLEHPPIRSLSLAIAQKCNLGCAYCYAQEGGFGGEQKNMEPEAARRAIDLLFDGAGPGDALHVSFLGGEPLTNRVLLRECVERAAGHSDRQGASVAFSVTTNGTLMTLEDGEFFEKHAFAVTISLDGVDAAHDRLRPFKGGQGSYERILSKVRPLLSAQRRMQVSARATVTPQNLSLRETLEEFLALGFHSVGFSPMLASPSGQGQMNAADLEAMLEQMIDCGNEFERQTLLGRRYAFLNMANALREIHKGTHRPYPCGAGAGYLGVAADGGLYACHRFVEDPAGAMGDVRGGLDRARQARWLADRHVHRQEPCR